MLPSMKFINTPGWDRLYSRPKYFASSCQKNWTPPCPGASMHTTFATYPVTTKKPSCDLQSTVMVPVGNMVFSLPFMPLKDSDIAGLGVILLGLVTYRLGDKCDVVARWRRGGTIIPRMPWRRGKKKTNRGISMTEEKFEWDAPVFHDDNEHQFASASLGEPLLLTPIR